MRKITIQETRTRYLCPACHAEQSWHTEWRGEYLPGNGRGGKGADCTYPVQVCDKCGAEFDTASAVEYTVDVEYDVPDPEPAPVGGFWLLDANGNVCGRRETEEEARKFCEYAATRGYHLSYREVA